MFSHASLAHPEHADLIRRELAISSHPSGSTDTRSCSSPRPLLEAPDQDRWEGRRDRALLALTAQAGLRAAELSGWLVEPAGLREEPLFPTRTGRRLSPDAVERLVRKHARTAGTRDPSFPADRVHPHVLRHTGAMNLLHHGVDTAGIALWLGYADIRSTTAYLHADMTIKEQALQRMATADLPTGRYRPSDKLLAFLDGL